MPESEMAQQVEKAVKAADRLVRNIRQNTSELAKAVRKIKALAGGNREDEEEKSE